MSQIQHVTMFKTFNNERGYLKCVISGDQKSDFESIGFVDRACLLKPVEDNRASPFDLMSDKKEIEEKLLELTCGDINIDRRGSVQTVADKAAKAYAQWLAANED